MRGRGFAGKVREALMALSKTSAEVTNADLAEKLDLVSGADKRPMYAAMRDMRKTGEVQRIRPGVHVYVGKNKPPEKKQIMWRLLRARKRVAIDDLVELAGVKRSYAREWLGSLVRQGVVVWYGNRSKPGKYVLKPSKDTVKMPENEEKAARLRALRRVKKKAALKAIDSAMDALNQARAAINEVKA